MTSTIRAARPAIMPAEAPFLSTSTSPVGLCHSMTKRCTAPPATMHTQDSSPIIVNETPGSTEPATAPSASTATTTAAESSDVARPAIATTHIIRDTRSTNGRNSDTAARSTINANIAAATYCQISPDTATPNARETISERFAIIGCPSCADDGNITLPKI